MTLGRAIAYGLGGLLLVAAVVLLLFLPTLGGSVAAGTAGVVLLLITGFVLVAGAWTLRNRPDHYRTLSPRGGSRRGARRER